MKKESSLVGKLPLSILQIGHGSFGRHLVEHLDRRVDQFVVTTERSLQGLDLKAFDYIFLATNDSSLQSLSSNLLKIDSNLKIVHFSGFYYFEGCLGLHPVASFNKESKYDLDQIHFVADGELDQNLNSLFPKNSRIEPAKKADYHNFLSVTANSLQLLVHKLGADFSKQLALDADLLKEIVAQSLNEERSNGSASFSGPWVRNEKDQQDKSVLKMKSESLKNLNELFIREINTYRQKEALNEHS